jgi:hypothetical protein
MKIFKATMAGAVVIAALVGALAMPAVAMAVPGGTPGPSAETAHAPKPSKKIVRKWRRVAGERRAYWIVQSRTLNRKLNRLSAIASFAASAGVDVTSVRTKIADSRAHLLTAKTLALNAIAKTRAIPYAADRKVAQAEALAAWKLTKAELRAAQADRRSAAVELRGLIKPVKLAARAKVKAADFR